jgi:hypothetical protein
MLHPFLLPTHLDAGWLGTFGRQSSLPYALPPKAPGLNIPTWRIGLAPPLLLPSQ